MDWIRGPVAVPLSAVINIQGPQKQGNHQQNKYHLFKAMESP